MNINKFLKNLIWNYWSDFEIISEMFLEWPFSELFLKFWSVNKHGISEWRILALYRHKENSCKFFSETENDKIKKLARAISKNQVSDPGPSWPSCFLFWFNQIVLDPSNPRSDSKFCILNRSIQTAKASDLCCLIFWIDILTWKLIWKSTGLFLEYTYTCNLPCWY